MTTENDNSAPPSPAPEAPTGFNAGAWQVLIGIASSTDPNAPGRMIQGLLFGMAADAEVCSPDGRPDKTHAAVHFAQWFDRNKAHLLALWEVEYAQYLNLRMATQSQRAGRPLKLVDPTGNALQ